MEGFQQSAGRGIGGESIAQFGEAGSCPDCEYDDWRLSGEFDGLWERVGRVGSGGVGFAAGEFVGPESFPGLAGEYELNIAFESAGAEDSFDGEVAGLIGGTRGGEAFAAIASRVWCGDREVYSFTWVQSGSVNSNRQPFTDLSF